MVRRCVYYSLVLQLVSPLVMPAPIRFRCWRMGSSGIFATCMKCKLCQPSVHPTIVYYILPNSNLHTHTHTHTHTAYTWPPPLHEHWRSWPRHCDCSSCELNGALNGHMKIRLSKLILQKIEQTTKFRVNCMHSSLVTKQGNCWSSLLLF